MPLTEAETEPEPDTEGQLLTDTVLLRVPDTEPVTDTDTQLELLMLALLLWLPEALPEGVGEVEGDPDTLLQLLAEELTDTDAEPLEDTLPVMLPDTVLEPLMLPLLELLTEAEAQEDTEPLMLPEDVEDTE